MIYTFANRTVGLVGQFEAPIEIMILVIEYLGGSVRMMVSKHYAPDVVVIGMNTSSQALDDIETTMRGMNNQPMIVYEGKIEDHMPDDRMYSDIIDRVKQELPWGTSY